MGSPVVTAAPELGRVVVYFRKSDEEDSPSRSPRRRMRPVSTIGIPENADANLDIPMRPSTSQGITAEDVKAKVSTRFIASLDTRAPLMVSSMRVTSPEIPSRSSSSLSSPRPVTPEDARRELERILGKRMTSPGGSGRSSSTLTDRGSVTPDIDNKGTLTGRVNSPGVSSRSSSALSGRRSTTLEKEHRDLEGTPNERVVSPEASVRTTSALSDRSVTPEEGNRDFEGYLTRYRYRVENKIPQMKTPTQKVISPLAEEEKTSAEVEISQQTIQMGSSSKKSGKVSGYVQGWRILSYGCLRWICPDTCRIVIKLLCDVILT